MGVHDWARAALAQVLEQGGGEGFDEALALRALLSAVVERSKGVRSQEDLAAELMFLADNLDDGREYAFMRP